MSNHLISEAYKRQVGNMARKAVMVLLADKASDDGSGIWASKQRMAEEIGASKQTVIATLKALIDDGLVRLAGKRKCPNGYTIEYAINVKALKALPLVKSHVEDQSENLTGQADAPVNEVNPTGQIVLPDQSENLTQTLLNPPEPKEEIEAKASRASDDAPALKPQHVFEEWNGVALRIGKRTVRDLTPARRELCRCRIGQYSIEDFVTVFGKVERSPFLREGRFCTFDWVMKRANFQKIIEGNYDD